MSIEVLIRKASYYLGLIIFTQTYTYADTNDWVQQEMQWWNQQQESLQQNFEPITEKPKSNNNSEFKLTETYWKTIKPYFFQNDTYVGYCVLDAYNDKLPLIITKVRKRNTYSITVDVNVYTDNIEDTTDLKLCHTDDLLNYYAWTDSQSIRYNSSRYVYEMYFKLCPLNQYPKTTVPGILIPLKTVIQKNNHKNELDQLFKGKMESILKNTNNESVWNENNEKTEQKTSQSPTTIEIQSWQSWFKETLNALKNVKFDFKKCVIEPTCKEDDLKFVFEKHFGKTKIKEAIEMQFQKKLMQLSEVIDQMKEQEIVLKSKIEVLQNRILELQSEKVSENVVQEKPILKEAEYITKDGRKIRKLKRVKEGNTILDTIKQYQDDSTNEKSNLSEETIQQLQEKSRQRILTKAKENMESTKRAEQERANGIQQFSSKTSNIATEMNQLFKHSNENEEFDPKLALKHIKNKDIPQEKPKQIQKQNKPGKLELDNEFKKNMESLLGGTKNSNSNHKKENLKKPENQNIDPAFEEKLNKNLGNINNTEENFVTPKEDFSFSTPPAPELKLDTFSKTKEINNRQQFLEKIMQKRQEILKNR